MFTLHLLGGLRLEGSTSDPTGRGTQRLRLAILALLAMAPGRRMSRDRMVAMLWPEAGADEGRSRLSSALYDLRQLLGEGALRGIGDDLWLEAGSLRVDAGEFVLAVAAEDWEQAEAHYTGPFLDGVHLEGSQEFEDWLAGHRDQLHRAFGRVLEQRARSAVDAGDLAEAEERWARLAGLEPLAGRWTLELMRVRAARDDRAGALRAGEALARRLREELDAPLDPGVARYFEELRSAPAPARAEPVGGVAAMRPRPDAAAAPATEPGPPQGTVSPVRRSRPILLGVAAAVMATVGLLSSLSLRRDRPAPDPGGSPIRIAVLRFTFTGDSALTFLRDGMVDLLSAALDGVGPFAAIDPHAVLATTARQSAPPDPAVLRQLGADRYVEGQVFGVGDSVHLQVVLRETGAGARRLDARVEGPIDAIPSLVDRLTARLVAAEFQDGANRIASVAAQTTLSLPALRAFLDGETNFRRGRFGAAIPAYRRAVTLDTTFALAHYRLSLAILWGNAPGAGTDYHDSLALAHAGRLSARDRELVLSYAAWRAGRGREALDRYTALTARHPDDVESWFQRAETEFHYGPRLGRAIADARVSLERVLALDPEHWGARWHLALLNAPEGRPARFQTTVAGLLAAGPDSVSATEMQLIAGRDLEGRPLDPAQAGEQELHNAAWRRAVYLRDWSGARVLAEALRAPHRSPFARRVGTGMLAELALAGGRWEEAREILQPDATGGGLEIVALGAILPGFERPVADRMMVRGQVERWIAELGSLLEEYPHERALAWRLQGLLAAATDDPDAAVRFAALLEGPRLPPDVAPLAAGWARGVRALLAWHDGEPERVVAELTTAEAPVWYGLAVTANSKSGGFERFLRAEALRALGRREEALRWYRSLEEHSLGDLVFLGPALLRSAELNAQLGRHTLALEQLGRAAELWRHADPDRQEHLRQHLAAHLPAVGR